MRESASPPLPTPGWEIAGQLTALPGLRVCLIGPPGVGKSRLARGSGTKRVFSLTLTEGTSMGELRGHYTLKGMEAIWHPGLVAQAWSSSHAQPTVLVLDELDHCSPESWSFLLQALDDHPAVLLPTGDVITPAPSLTVIATANSLEGVPAALLDRFPLTLSLPTPHPEIAGSLPSKVAHLPLTTRQQLTLVQLLPSLSIETILRCFFPEPAATEFAQAWILNAFTTGPSSGKSPPPKTGKS